MTANTNDAARKAQALIDSADRDAVVAVIAAKTAAVSALHVIAKAIAQSESDAYMAARRLTGKP